MKKIFWIIFLISSLPVYSSSFNALGKDSKIIENELDFSDSSLSVVQKRWIPKNFLSEFSLSLSPILRGFNYMHNYSMDFSYRLFLNNHWSMNLKYSNHFNLFIEEVLDEIKITGRIPLELKHSPKRSYFLGIDWYPFYGKMLLYNKLVRFDLYLSISGGFIELLNVEKKASAGSLSFGAVHWWHKYFNTRLELQGFYYKYQILDEGKTVEIDKPLYKLSLSAGFLF